MHIFPKLCSALAKVFLLKYTSAMETAPLSKPRQVILYMEITFLLVISQRTGDFVVWTSMIFDTTSPRAK